MREHLLAKRITMVGKMPDSMRLVAYHRGDQNAEILQDAAELTYEIHKESRIYAVHSGILEVPLELHNIANCLCLDGKTYLPKGNAVIRISIDNLAGFRQFLEKEGWPESVSFENVYERHRGEIENMAADMIQRFSERITPWTWQELHSFFTRTPSLTGKMFDQMWRIFWKEGIEVEEPLKLLDISQPDVGIIYQESRNEKGINLTERNCENRESAKLSHEAGTLSYEQPMKCFEQLTELTENKQDASNQLTPSEAIWPRVLLGQKEQGKPVYWEFGHNNLANRHLLVTGRSGEGKTYAIQCFLTEMAKIGVSSVIIDYTDGFLPERLDHGFLTVMGGKIRQKVAITERIPVNPFLLQDITISGITQKESSVLAAGRFAAIMKHVYSFGDQQHSVVYKTCRDGIDRFGKQMSFVKLRQLIEDEGTPVSKTVLAKMQQLFDLDIFDTEHALNWNQITRAGGCATILQLSKLSREIQTVITEILMWDCWYAIVKSGRQDQPFVMVFDEAQNLSFLDGSPAQKILQEGRKYGWSAWFATQFLKGALSSDEISRLYQAAESIYFRPSPEEVKQTAERLAAYSGNVQQWMMILERLGKGDCVVKGMTITPDGRTLPSDTHVIHITALENRG